MSYLSPSTHETFRLGPFTTTRIWNGLWQLSSNAWGSASVPKIRRGMKHHVQLGYRAFDMVWLLSVHLSFSYSAPTSVYWYNWQADHYGCAEAIFGQFQESLPPSGKALGATKWCVFNNIKPSRSVVEDAVRERMERMRMNHVDLLQFYWQNYSDKGYLTALETLFEMQSEGMISAIGLCNFDTIRTDEICTQLGPGVIVSNQVQFSLIDTRPLHGMVDVCERHGLKLLTYGTLCGGFLSDKWLNQPEPALYGGKLTPSQRKYLDIIVRAWGSWDLFQSLLTLLRAIGDRHGGLSISNIATRWVLDHPFVGAVIIGVRLGLSEHPDDNHKVFGFTLTAEDRAAIDALLERSDGRSMITTIGDCGAEYRQ